LRRNETRMLDVTDFGTNPHAHEFGEHGVCYVRHGKAMKGSLPKRRSVLTRLALGQRGPRRVDHPDPSPAHRHPGPGHHGIVALGAGTTGRTRTDRRPLRWPAHQPGIGPGRGFPLAAPLLRHTPDRSRVGPAVRPASLEPPRGCPRRATRGATLPGSAWWRRLSAAVHHADDPEVRCLCSGC
jgi:hypothetical protein